MKNQRITFNYWLNGKLIHYNCNELRQLHKSISKENEFAPKLSTMIIAPRYKGTIFVKEPSTVEELIYCIENNARRVQESDLRKYSTNDYTRVGIYDFDEVFPYLITPDAKKDFLKEYNGRQICMNNPKYHVFKKSRKCVCCGLEGEYLALEQCKKDGNSYFHFNMYGIVNGREVLFTKDHILPKSKGGKNSLDNYQTMCTQCNAEKGNSNISLESLRKKVIHKRQRALEVERVAQHVS